MHLALVPSIAAVAAVIVVGTPTPDFAVSVGSPTRQETSRANDALAALFKDPSSLQVKVSKARRINGQAVVCGLVNAKNGYGGYVGFRPFFVIGESATYDSAQDNLEEQIFQSWYQPACGDSSRKQNAPLTLDEAAEIEARLNREWTDPSHVQYRIAAVRHVGRTVVVCGEVTVGVLGFEPFVLLGDDLQIVNAADPVSSGTVAAFRKRQQDLCVGPDVVGR